MTSYDTNDISGYLTYIADRFGMGIFAVPGRVPAILSDLAPALTRERAMLERMSRHGILADFVQADARPAAERERVIAKALVTLTESEFIAPHIAARYVRILVNLFQWNLPVNLPGPADTGTVIQFDAKQHLADTGDPDFSTAVAALAQEDYENAFPCLERAFRRGNLPAGVLMATLYRLGYGCPRSETKAFQILMVCYKENHPLAGVWLAEYYRMGWGVPADKKKARQIYDRCAGALAEMCAFGDPQAQYVLGHNLLYGTYGTHDNKQALIWLEKAAAANPSARFDLAKCCLYGWGGPADIDKGLRLLRQCAQGRNPKAHYELGLLYCSGKHVPQDFGKAFPLIEYAAQHDHAAAQNRLGEMYLWGKGVPEDEAKAFHWHIKSANAGNKTACEHTGLHYWFGRAVPKNEKLAFQYFKKAADQGSVRAQYLLHHFLRGEVDDKSLVDYGLCCHYLELASTNGHAAASRVLAEMYLDDRYGMADRKKYHAWMAKAAQQGDAPAQMCLGEMYLEGFIVDADEQTAFQWLSKAVAQKQTDAYVLLAGLHLTGRTVQRDHDRAFQYLEQAAQNLSSDKPDPYYSTSYLHFKIASLYEKHHRSSAEKGKAFLYYHLAWQEGHTDAVLSLGWLYYIGKCTSPHRPVDEHALIAQLKEYAVKSDRGDAAYLLGHIYGNYQYPAHSIKASQALPEAEKWRLMAIEKGRSAAYYDLIVQYFNNEKRYSDAFALAEKGHQAGVAAATYALAFFYRHGTGVQKDRSKAKELFRQAAKKGHEGAQAELKKFLFH